MKRKSLLFVLLLALMVPWTATAQETVTIGDGTTTQYYVPIGTYYNYSISEQLYTADEIGTAGTIQSISFYYAGTIAKDFPITVYMKHVDASNLSTGISLADATQVFNGTYSVSASSGWYAITLDTPFEYDGESNLLIGINKGYLYWYSNGNWQGTAISNMARYSNQDGGAYTTSTIPGTIQANRPNLQLSIIPQAASACANPETLVASDVTSASATLTWTGGSGTYNVDIKGGSYTDWTSVLAGTTLLTTMLTDLDANTAYQARVQSACGTDPETGDPVTSGWKNVSFRTACGTITNFPWTETFESFAGGVFNDPCWVNEHIEGGGTSIFQISTSSMGGNTTHQLQLPDMSIGTLTKLVLPEMNLPSDNYQFVINVYRSTSTYNDNYPSEGIRVFASTDGNIEGATELAFIPRHYQVSNAVIPAEASDGWYEYELPIGISGTCYIILRGESQYCTSTYMDNLAVQQIPTCPKPRSLAYSDVTGHTANLTWTPGAEGQTQWQICLNGDEENLILVNSTEGAYTLTGLSGQTPYTVKVRAYCSETDQSYWSNQVSFTTAVTCVTPTGLTNSNVTNHSATLNWTSDATEWILAYKLYSAHDSTYIEVPVTEKPYILDGLTPETRYMVRVRANCGEEDGLSTWSGTTNFTLLEAYPAPGNLTCDSTFAYSAYFSWDERGSATDWEVAYKLATDPDDAYIIEPTPDNHPFMLGEDPLLPGTDYVLRVRSVYFNPDTTSTWSAVVPFTTLQTCPAPTEFAVIDSTINAYGATLNWNSNYSDSWTVKYREPAYMDGIDEDFSAAPTGWSFRTGVLNADGTATLSGTSSWSRGTYNGVFDTHIYMNLYSTKNYWLITPNMTVNATDNLSFDMAYTAYSGTQATPALNCTTHRFAVLISTDEMATWTILREWNNNGSEFVLDNVSQTGENVSIDLSSYAGQTVNIAFFGHSETNSYDNNMHFDNVAIGTPVPATEWTEVAADAVPFELTGLNPETYYEVVVTSTCGDETSEESASVFFTTTPSCLAPTELAVANESVTAHAATLSWTENGSATEWVIEYTAVVNDTTVTNTINVTENPYTLTGLLAETPYAVKVQAYCSTTDQSDWSNTVRFTTLVACPAPTNLAVDEESITTESATVAWEGTSDSYIVMIGEPDPENVIPMEVTLVDTDFEDQVIPAAFTNSTSYPWTVAAGGANGSGYCVIPGNSGVNSSSSDLTIVVTGPGTVSFNAKVSSESNWDYGRFLIDGTQMLNISGTQDWTTRTYELAEGEHTLIWRYYKDGSGYSGSDLFYVDDINITGTILMPIPSSWTEIPADETTYTFDNLEPGTTYFVQVKSDCGEEGESVASNIISFTTVATCVVPTDFAATDVTAHTATLVWNGENDSYVVNYRVAAGTQDWINADFENGLPDGWTNEGASSWSVGTGDYSATTGAHSGTYNAKINHGTTGDVTYLVSPAIDLSEQSDLTLKLWYINRSWAGDTDGFGIYYRIDGGAWNEIFATTDAHSIWTEFNQALPAGAYAANCQFGFKFTDGYGYGVGLDDINISIPTPAGEWMTATAADTTVVLNSLAAETTYEAMVQAVCTEEDSSDWTEIISFTTAIACPAPISLAIANVTDSITAHTATINWIETGMASAWEICLNNDEDNLIIANDTIFTLTDLAQDAEYTVKVRANCGELDGNSAWSNTVTFHTIVACAVPTNLAADNIGTESATLMWEGQSDSYVVQYVPYNQVGEDQTTTGVLTTYTYDLSEFEGMGTIVIRHYDVSDMFRLNVDDIMVTNAQNDTIFSEDFEGTISSQLSTMDRDGDGYGWYTASSTEVDAQGNPYCNGSNFITSASYDNSVGALEPDNWLIISGVELGGQLTFVARGQDPEWSGENFAVFISPEEGAGEEIVDGDNMLDLWDLTPNTSYAWQVQGICGADTSNWAASFFTTMDDVLVFVTDGDWDNVDNWEPAELPTTDKNVRIEANAIIPAGVIAEANKVSIEEGGSITIKDGGQLKQNSATLQVTMEKEITGYGEGTGNYYLISSPFTGRTQFGESSWNHVENLIDGTYDLYTFDPTFGEGEEWVNYKANPAHIAYQSEAQGNAGLFEEVGYLYANQDTITLNFIGKTSKSNNASTEPKALVCDSINKGWALMGNLYACNAYLTVVDSLGETMEANYYVMNAAGDNIELAETTDGIAPLNSVFIYLETTGYYQLNSEMPAPAKSNRTGKFIMNLSQGSENVDQAVVRFGKGRNLPKMSLKNNSKLYFSNNDKDYAVVYSSKADNMPVNFKAETAGSYTISFAADGVSFKELVLVDNVNETKVDLLANPSYTFETEAGEFAGRFTIVYRVK